MLNEFLGISLILANFILNNIFLSSNKTLDKTFLLFDKTFLPFDYYCLTFLLSGFLTLSFLISVMLLNLTISVSPYFFQILTFSKSKIMILGGNISNSYLPTKSYSLLPPLSPLDFISHPSPLSRLNLPPPCIKPCMNLCINLPLRRRYAAPPPPHQMRWLPPPPNRRYPPINLKIQLPISISSFFPISDFSTSFWLTFLISIICICIIILPTYSNLSIFPIDNSISISSKCKSGRKTITIEIIPNSF